MLNISCVLDRTYRILRAWGMWSTWSGRPFRRIRSWLWKFCSPKLGLGSLLASHTSASTQLEPMSSTWPAKPSSRRSSRSALWRSWVSRLLASSVLSLQLLEGCAQREGWIRPDMNDQQRMADLYACERDQRMVEAGPRFFRRCMEAKGYAQP